MKKYLFYIAVVGWTLGLTVHLSSLADYDVGEKFPFVWILYIGIFVVWLPTILELRKNEALKEYQKSGMLNRMNPVGFYKIIFKNTPTWLAGIGIGGLFYAFINFALFIASQHGTPDIKDEHYVLQSHGQLVKILTEQEYHHYKANEVRGFSGHWLAFYGLSAAVLFPFSKKQNDKHF